jgi:hypothetical protein
MKRVALILILAIAAAALQAQAPSDEDISKLSWGEIQATVKHLIQLGEDRKKIMLEQKDDLAKAHQEAAGLQTKIDGIAAERDAWKDAEKNSEVKIEKQRNQILIQWGIIGAMVLSAAAFLYLKAGALGL